MRYVKDIDAGTKVHCPGCGGELVVRRNIQVPLIIASFVGDDYVPEQYTIPYSECTHYGRECEWWKEKKDNDGKETQAPTTKRHP